MIRTRLILLVSLAALLFGCTSLDAGQPASTAPQPVAIVSNTAAPPTPSPTASPVPPSSTPQPTGTASPTATQIPTQTPPPPTSTPTITPTFSPLTMAFEPGEPVRIGYLLWESNAIGLDSRRGVELAIQALGGDLLGHPVELLGYDDQCSELGGQRGAQLLALDDQVVGIIGPTCSPAAIRGAPIVTNAGKLMVSPSASTPDLTDAETRAAGFFRTSPNDLNAVVAVAGYAFNQLGARKMAVLYTDGVKLHRLRSQNFCASFSDLGGECVLDKAIAPDATYFEPVINDIIMSGAEVVHLIHNSDKVAAGLISAVRQNAKLSDLPIFLGERFFSQSFLEQAREAAVGVYVSTTPVDFDHDNRRYVAARIMYRQKYKEDPIAEYHAFAYDAAMLLMKAIETAAVLREDGSLLIDPLAVREAMYLLGEVQGVTGVLACTPSGDCTALHDGRIYQYADGDPSTFHPGPKERLDSNPVQIWP